MDFSKGDYTVAGIDPSLTATGIAVIESRTGVGHVATIYSVGLANATLEERNTRLIAAAARILDALHNANADLAVIEAPAYSRRVGSAHDRSGLWWHIVRELFTAKFKKDCCRYGVIEIPPTVRAKYATGRGNAPKDEVLAATIRRYRSIDVTNNNEADALILAAIGARVLGQAIDAGIPKANLAAIAKIPTPEEVTE